jgi:FtsH-binding integral membrane protein
MATLNLQKILNFDMLEKPVQEHLKQVYSCLAVTMLVAAVGSYVYMVYLQLGLLTLFGSLGCLFALHVTPHSAENFSKRMAMLSGFAFFSGMSLGPVLDMAIRVDPSIVPTAFMATSLIFICFTMATLLSRDRKFLFLGGFLMSGLSWMLLLGLLNIFIGSRLIYQFNLYAGLVIMCGFVLYDTQLIVEKRRMGDTDYIWHCVDLFIDFINIFRRLLIILAQKEENKKRRN